MNTDAKNEILEQISCHCQKITEALYRITELFPSKEPLKWILREECLKIFRLFISLKNSSLRKNINSFEEIFEKIDRMISLLDIAAGNSFITNINFNVLKREYLNLKNFIALNKTLYLSINEIDFNKLFAISESNGHDNGHSGQNNEVKNDVMSVIMSDNNMNNMSERSNQILRIINSKPGKDITLNEACLYFKDISQKTIQRELAKLVYEGVLKAKGEKRWRRYIIKN